MRYKLPVLLLMGIPYVVYFNPVACFYPVLYVSFILIKLEEKKINETRKERMKVRRGREGKRKDGGKKVSPI